MACLAVLCSAAVEFWRFQTSLGDPTEADLLIILAERILQEEKGEAWRGWAAVCPCDAVLVCDFVCVCW